MNPSSPIPNYPCGKRGLLAGDSFTAVNVGRILDSYWTTKCKVPSCAGSNDETISGVEFLVFDQNLMYSVGVRFISCDTVFDHLKQVLQSGCGIYVYVCNAIITVHEVGKLKVAELILGFEAARVAESLRRRV